MFLHLSDDEKFIDSAWKAFTSADSAANHRFVVISDKRKLEHIRAFIPERLSPRDILAPDVVDNLPSFEGVFLHSLNSANRAILSQWPQSNFIWIGWGFDYYHLIAEPPELWLPMTRVAMSRRSLTRRPLLGDRSLGKWLNSPADRWRNLLRQRAGRADVMPDISSLNRARFFAPVLESEYMLIRQKHPQFQPQLLSWNYGVHEILASVPRGPSRRQHKIMVGNSATPECNHLDAFSWLRQSGYRGEVICPLSYGNMRYRKLVLSAGVDTFGDKFNPLLDFVDSKRYMELIAESSHLLMMHRRQQGLGNILAALQSGSRVVMLPENPLAVHLGKSGFELDTPQEGFKDTCLPTASIERHRELVECQYGAPMHAWRTRRFIDSARALASNDTRGRHHV